ncbi:MAG: glycoside hydrolase [Candidatus Omnitrophica bacterium]|nr:glycoside hydrolase [Candidatus Omnitrophota bacterium]
MKTKLWSSCEVAKPSKKQDIIVYRDDEYCSNWPMSGGMWRFDDDEILVGFTRLKVDYKKVGSTNHLHLDTWGQLCLVRSKDDGETWENEVEVVVNKRDVAIEFFQEGKQNLNQNPVDFTSPDTILLCNYVGEHLWAKTYGEVRFWSMIMASPDRGKSWPLGPIIKKPRHLFSAWGLPNYVIRPNGNVLIFNDCVPCENEKDGQMYIYCDILENNGLCWNYFGILPLERRDARLIIHGSPVMIGETSILLAVRAQTPPNIVYVMLYRSDDYGRNWYTIGRVTDIGGTPHLLRLRDGRILLTYERRFPPCGIRARISEDAEGIIWGPEIVLRDDGESDIGYSRSVQRKDGSILTVYYFVNAAERKNNQEPTRYIAGTIWKP